jgi:hypothetical protein
MQRDDTLIGICPVCDKVFEGQCWMQIESGEYIVFFIHETRCCKKTREVLDAVGSLYVRVHRI